MIYIPSDVILDLPDKELFILVRSFKGESAWENNYKLNERWGISADEFQYIPDLREADIMLLPYTINHYIKFGYLNKLGQYNDWCSTHQMKAYGYISGDRGRIFPEFSHISYFRMGGFKSQLSPANLSFPFGLSDQYEKIHGKETIVARNKPEIPTVGFCGHASFSLLKKYTEIFYCIAENVRRWMNNPRRKDYEPLFPSAYMRALLLRTLEKCEKIKTNFIYRQQYRAGAKTLNHLKDTTRQYYNNMVESDYVVCVRGGGNFSVRLFETLMMGKIPVFVNTDCLLPFFKNIDWHNRMVWVEWEERHLIGDKIAHFHNSLTNEQFKTLQLSNRSIWKNELSVKGMLHLISTRYID